MKRLTSYTLLLVGIIVLSCRPSKTPPVQPGFYYWKNHFTLSKNEREYLRQLNCKKIYLRFFDIDWDAKKQQAVPLSILTPGTVMPDTIEVIPTIFITNRTMQYIAERDIELLAKRIIRKIKEQLPDVTRRPLTEIQLDCDWTATTRHRYFLLLQQLTNHSKGNWQCASTIRLHQLKYPEKTGVPPVDKGMLMCYNMADIQNVQTKNSIIDTSTLTAYLNGDTKAYPLHLDVALPIFQWGVLYRNGQLIKLIHRLGRADLHNRLFYLPKGESLFEVRQNTYLYGHYLYPNDIIRLERVEKDVLKNAAKQLQSRLATAERTIVFYHLDSTNIAEFPVAELLEVLRVGNEEINTKQQLNH